MGTTRLERDALLSLAVDLTRSLGGHHRAERVLKAVRTILPCDAASLLVLKNGVLHPLATHGLVPAVSGMRFPVAEYPRLAKALNAGQPVHLNDSDDPDPFDGLILGDKTALRRVHACLGCPLEIGDEVVGLLTADAFDPFGFQSISPQVLAWLSALAGAALATIRLVDNLEQTAERLGQALRTRPLVPQSSSSINEKMVGQSTAMKQLRDDIRVAARTCATVLIEGESGTGKELVAQAIHEQSNRAEAPLVIVNCAALPSAMAESELFGHEQGAFTDALSKRKGRWESAEGGTLFLDEIGELSSALQAKLLRVLQSGEIQRVGSDTCHRVDARIIAATNRNLLNMVEKGDFRSDLYHRLSVLPIRTPPLRDRAEDIPALMGAFAQETARRLRVGPVRFLPDATEWASNQSWLGNVRELENIVFRAILRVSARLEPNQVVIINIRDLARDHRTQSHAPCRTQRSIIVPLGDQVAEFERRAIHEAVDRANGNWSQAARMLGLDRSNLYRRAKRLGIRD